MSRLFGLPPFWEVLPPPHEVPSSWPCDVYSVPSIQSGKVPAGEATYIIVDELARRMPKPSSPWLSSPREPEVEKVHSHRVWEGSHQSWSEQPLHGCITPPPPRQPQHRQQDSTSSSRGSSGERPSTAAPFHECHHDSEHAPEDPWHPLPWSPALRYATEIDTAAPGSISPTPVGMLIAEDTGVTGRHPVSAMDITPAIGPNEPIYVPVGCASDEVRDILS